MLRSTPLLVALLGLAFGVLPGCAYRARPGYVRVSPGVAVVDGYDDVYYSGGAYWYQTNGLWYRSSRWDGGWVRVQVAPARVRRAYARPGRVVVHPNRGRVVVRPQPGRVVLRPNRGRVDVRPQRGRVVVRPDRGRVVVRPDQPRGSVRVRPPRGDDDRRRRGGRGRGRGPGE